MTVDRNSATYRFAKSSTIATLEGIDAASTSVAFVASDVVDFTDEIGLTMGRNGGVSGVTELACNAHLIVVSMCRRASGNRRSCRAAPTNWRIAHRRGSAFPTQPDPAT